MAGDAFLQAMNRIREAGDDDLAAREELQRVADRPDLPPLLRGLALGRLGLAHHLTSETAAAAPLLERALALIDDPGEAIKIHYHLADALELLDRPTEAAEHFRAFLASGRDDPGYYRAVPDALLRLATIVFSQGTEAGHRGDFDGAAKRLEEARLLAYESVELLRADPSPDGAAAFMPFGRERAMVEGLALMGRCLYFGTSDRELYAAAEHFKEAVSLAASHRESITDEDLRLVYEHWTDLYEHRLQMPREAQLVRERCRRELGG